MRHVLPLLMLAALAGCAPAPAPVPAPASNDAKPAAARPKLHTFAFFVSDLQARDPRIVDYVQADCGMVAITRVPAIPIDDELIIPDLVVQFDEAGGELRRWAKSYSSEILAISGDDLYFGDSVGGDAGPFRTTPAGDVTVAVPLATNLEADASYIDCPASMDAFADMSMVTCYETNDVAGRKLRLAWEAACP